MLYACSICFYLFREFYLPWILCNILFCYRNIFAIYLLLCSYLLYLQQLKVDLCLPFSFSSILTVIIHLWLIILWSRSNANFWDCTYLALIHPKSGFCLKFTEDFGWIFEKSARNLALATKNPTQNALSLHFFFLGCIKFRICIMNLVCKL